jgi:hypothetical protein
MLAQFDDWLVKFAYHNGLRVGRAQPIASKNAFPASP